MPWVKLDDHFDENPKILKVGPLGMALWVSGLAYCNRNLTDGFIPSAIAVRMLSLEFSHPGDGQPMTILVGGERADDDEQMGCVPSRFYIANMLVDAGLWDLAPGGYMVHDYQEFQPTRAQIEAERAEKQAAGRAGGQASAKARAQAKSNGTESGRSTDSQAESKPVPVPVPTTSNEVGGAVAPKPRKRLISREDVTRWEGAHPTVDIPAMVKDYENWTGSSKHTDKVLGFENQLRDSWRLEKFRKQAVAVGQNVNAIHQRNLDLERIAWERKNPGVPYER